MKTATETESRSAETRLIPLRLLREDDANVRADPATAAADAELVASIRAHGLLENLVVTPRTKTLFGVVAGARRYRALRVLADENHIPRNLPVPCLVVDNDVASESSLAENAVRVAMHPADQVAAFSRLAADGATAEQIAARFGIAERTVQKRVRLGGLPAEILDAYRSGAINLATAEAFAATTDVEFQKTMFDALKDNGQLHPHAVRHALQQRQARSDSPSALFVGLDAYRDAGGAVEDPLFEDYLTIADPALLLRLAMEKLETVAATYAAWKWTETRLEFGWGEQQKYLLAAADKHAEFTEAETQALDEAETTIEEASERLDDPQLDADALRDLWAAVTRKRRRYADIERARADRDEYSDSVRAHSGVIVALDREGCVEVHQGLVRAEDADAYRDAVSVNGDPAVRLPAAEGSREDAGSGKKNGGYSDALRSDLRVMRTAAIRRALARDPKIATDLIGFVLARMVGFGEGAGTYQRPVLSLRQNYQGFAASDAMEASPVMRHLETAPPDVELDWLRDNDAASAFRFYRGLPDAQRASALSHAVAGLTVPQLADDGDISPALEQAVADLDIDFPTELAAIGAAPFDQDLVWKRMTKGLILDAGAATFGGEWSLNRARLTKKELVASAAAAFRHDDVRGEPRNEAAARWLPPGFVRPAAEGATPPETDACEIQGTDTGVQNDSANLPSFLKDD